MTILILVSVFTSLSFLYYGFSCLMLQKMKSEFERFGLSGTQRKITGTTQIVGSVAILVGLQYPLFGFLGALGLYIQMALGVQQRIKIGDRFHLILPAYFFAILNAYLAYLFYLKIALLL